MKIFYFTGTGNSLWIARKIADSFSADLVSVSDYNGEEVSDDVIGFVFPVYMGDVPWYFKRFLLSLNARAKYRHKVLTKPFVKTV